jgi:hypothetical protein
MVLTRTSLPPAVLRQIRRGLAQYELGRGVGVSAAAVSLARLLDLLESASVGEIRWAHNYLKSVGEPSPPPTPNWRHADIAWSILGGSVGISFYSDVLDLVECVPS